MVGEMLSKCQSHTDSYFKNLLGDIDTKLTEQETNLQTDFLLKFETLLTGIDEMRDSNLLIEKSIAEKDR